MRRIELSPEKAAIVDKSDYDNMQELVYRTMRENHISDPGELQPGQLIIIHVRRL